MSFLCRGRHLFLGIPFLVVFFLAERLFASESPILLSPADNSIEDKSPKLVWEYKGVCAESGSCFRVEVDNNSDFSSPEKSSYTNSFSYSPQGLPNGEWYWHVKAKDNVDVWSGWSVVYKFTIGATPTPTPPSQNPPSPTPEPSSLKTGSSFNIKNIPESISSDQDFEVGVFLDLPDKANTRFYLKGAFKKSDSSNYFGESFVGGSWVRNNSSYSNQFRIETDQSGKWEGKIKIRPDSEDSGFDGTGEYVLKVGRYTDTGSGPSWSNEIPLKIIATETPEPSEEPEVIDEEYEEEIEVQESIVKSALPYPSREYEIKIASVAGEATMSNNIPLEEHIQVLEAKKVNWLLIILGSGVLMAGVGYVVYKIKLLKK